MDLIVTLCRYEMDGRAIQVAFAKRDNGYGPTPGRCESIVKGVALVN